MASLLERLKNRKKNIDRATEKAVGGSKADKPTFGKPQGKNDEVSRMERTKKRQDDFAGIKRRKA